MTTNIDLEQQFDLLTTAELEELEAFLESDQCSDNTMTLEMLDGFLTAIIIGPTTLPFSTWFPYIWGPTIEDMPKFESKEELEHITGLIIRHANSISNIAAIDPDQFQPILNQIPTDELPEGLYTDGSLWADGFLTGVGICSNDWTAFFDDEAAFNLLTPIYLLGSDDVSDEILEEHLSTALQHHELSELIPEIIGEIHQYWLPYRKAKITVKREGIKVGRNDACPCGSGKKYKKCCMDSNLTLH